MQYYSTANHKLEAGFRKAVIEGQPKGGGLYFPVSIPRVPPALLNEISDYTKEEIAFTVMRPYTGSDIPANALMRIAAETVSFDFPLVQVDGRSFALELFHGPTLAFKDVGARFMSRCLGYFAQDREITVLVATSGDTGSAVASAFYEVEGVRVVILYPSGKVSQVQEQQLTTWGKNITALEVAGNFDDCQRMVKAAFADETLKAQRSLTSANSINIARWLPQQLYYFFAWQQWPEKEAPPVIAVPSGNFGNLCAGLLAMRSGLPIDHFIAACNANDSVVDFLNGHDYTPKQPVPTLSNAMDVGDPSNFIRLLELYDHDASALRKAISGYTVTDEQTRNTMRDLFDTHQYTADPHGAIAYTALKRYRDQHPDRKGIFLETAHPIKFSDPVSAMTGKEIPIPPQMKGLLEKKKASIKMNADVNELKAWLAG